LHTHLLHRSCYCWKRQRRASVGFFCTSTVAFDLMYSMVAKCVPLRGDIFRLFNILMLLGGGSGEYAVWVMTEMFFLREQLLQIPLSLQFVAPLPPNCIQQPLRNLHVEITSDTISQQYKTCCTKPSMTKNFRNYLTTARS
jgi:hypothetical protein